MKRENRILKKFLENDHDFEYEDESFSETKSLESLVKSIMQFNKDDGISLYDEIDFIEDNAELIKQHPSMLKNRYRGPSEIIYDVCNQIVDKL